MVQPQDGDPGQTVRVFSIGSINSSTWDRTDRTDRTDRMDSETGARVVSSADLLYSSLYSV